MLDTATHGRARDILNVSTLVHVIVHAHKEESIGFEASRSLLILGRPSKAMAMHWPLMVISAESRCIDAIGVRSFVQLIVAKVGIVCDILVHTVLIVFFVAVTIVVICLPVAWPAALGGMGCAHGRIKLWKLWHFEDRSF